MVSERLKLTPFTLSDLPELHSIFIHPFVRKYLWDDIEVSAETVREILQKNETHFNTDRWGIWKISKKEDHHTMGFVGLWFFFDEPQPQLIYGLLPEYSGKGYATEASRCVIQYAFEELGFDHVIAATDAPHLESQAVAQRLGMARVDERMEDGKPTVFFRIENAKYGPHV